MADDHPYKIFLRIVKDNVYGKIEHDRNTYADNGEALEALAKSVFDSIATEQAVELVKTAIENEDERVRNALLAELKFFNMKYGNSNDGTALSAADTVKSSIHCILTLPNWLKKLLKILNELISLLKASQGA